MRHVPAYGSIRAVTALCVMAHHVLFAYSPATFMGVDVFFVLSGFFVTMSLAREFDRVGHLDLSKFYARRVRRTYPSLLALLVICGAVVALVAGPSLIENTLKDSLAVLGSCANWTRMWGVTGVNHLGHLWSLSITEQFYLVWPLALPLILRAPQKRGEAVTGLLAFGILVWTVRACLGASGLDSLQLSSGASISISGATPARLDGLLIGSAAGLAAGTPGLLRLPRRAGLWAALATLGCLALAPMLLPWSWWSSPVLRALGPSLVLVAEVSCAVVLLNLQDPSSPLHRVMTSKVLQWIGDRSLGIYLWHLPLRVALVTLVPEFRDPLHQLGLGPCSLLTGSVVAVTFILADLSLRLVERPLLAPGTRPVRSPLCHEGR